MIKYILCFFLSFMFCSKPGTDTAHIVAKIDNRIITADDFIVRSEFTIRPKFYMQTDSTHKNFVLNSLIAEKLFALQADKHNQLTHNPHFQGYIRGIREQAMREQLYFQQAFNQVRVDSAEIFNHYSIASREYELAFYSLHDTAITARIENKIQNQPDSAAILFDGLGDPTTVHTRKIDWNSQEPDIIHDALFTGKLDVGQVIGPIDIAEGYALIMKIVDWRDHIVIGPENQKVHFKNITKKLREKKAHAKWNEYVNTVMQGKKLEIQPKPFKILTDHLFRYYAQKTMQKHSDISEKEITRVLQEIDNPAFLDQPFLMIDNKVWTVRDFKQILISHPLVYRKPEFTHKKQYQKQFKFAVIDLVRDYFMTKEAYKKSLDEHPEVKSKETMWRDAWIAQFHRDQYIEEKKQDPDFDPKYMAGRINYISLYLDSLQQKYSDKIRINRQLLKNIELTRTDAFVKQIDAPFPIAVPAFPMFAANDSLDYGQ